MTPVARCASRGVGSGSRTLGAMPSRRTDRLRPASIVSHLGVMVAVAAVMGVLVAGLAIPFAAVTGLSTRTVADSMDKIPSDLTAEPLAQVTRLLGRDGAVLASGTFTRFWS